MKLVYIHNQMPVSVGDEVQVDGDPYEVVFFSKPHKPSSSGKITVAPVGTKDFGYDREFFVQIIGAEWIEREDQ